MSAAARFLPGAVMAAAALVCLFQTGPVGRPLFELGTWGHYASQGESLRHGLRSERVRLDRLPLSTLTAAWAADSGVEPARLFALLSLTGMVLGAFVAWRLGGARAAAAASVLLAWKAPLIFVGNLQAVHVLLVLTTVGALLWREEAPVSEAGTLAAAAALGATLLFRSALALLPPLLAWRELRAGRRKPALMLLLVPYLFLIPWTRLNFADHGRFVPFENGPADGNIVTGALGRDWILEGEWRALTGETDPKATALGWAAREVARHPLRYAYSCLRRFVLTVRLAPLLWVGAAAGFFLTRARASTRLLALVCLYYAGVHDLMSLEPSHFQPLWALLCALAAAAVAAPVATGISWPEGAFAVWTSGLVACAAWACALLATYPPRFGVEDTAVLESSLKRFPADAWLRSERAGRRLKTGDVAGACADFDAAAQPAFLSSWESFWLLRAVARLQAGKAWSVPQAGPLPERLGHALTAAGCLKAGKDLCAREEAALAARPEGGDGPWSATLGLETTRRAEQLAPYMTGVNRERWLALLRSGGKA